MKDMIIKIPNEMSREEAEKYIKHGPEMQKLLERFRKSIFRGSCAGGRWIDETLTKLGVTK